MNKKLQTYHILKDIMTGNVKIYDIGSLDAIDFEEQFDESLKNKVELQLEECSSKIIAQAAEKEMTHREHDTDIILPTKLIKCLCLEETYLSEEQKKAIMLKIFNIITEQDNPWW